MEDTTLIFRILVIVVLVGFLPMCALTYYTFRLGQRKLEIQRILDILQITSQYRHIYSCDIGPYHFGISVFFAMTVAIIGLSSLFLSAELALGSTPNLLLSGSIVTSTECNASKTCIIAYQQGALMMYGIGFMGAYLWGLQSIFRRYSMNDLLPVAFFHFGLRMIFSSIVALLFYHAVGGFSGDYREDTVDPQLFSPTSDGVKLLVAFLLGMFPQRGIKWMMSKATLLTSEIHTSVRDLPLEMIEGLSAYDKDRLQELGIDSCYDLATADFIPLLLKTPYGSRELIDWLLQAKLCVRFGDAVNTLREQGFRLITDLEGLHEDYLEQLAKDTSLTLSSLQRAAKATESDHNIARLKRAAESLGKYWEGESNRLREQDC